MRTFKTALLAAVALPVVAVTAQAAPATWSATPVNNNFNNAANWSAGGPPGSGEQGTFGATNQTVVQFVDPATTTGGFTFNSGSPAYTILVTNGRTVTVNGAGNTRLVSPLITEQTITFSVDSLGDLRFIGTNASNGPGSIVYANAGNLLINGGTAGNATIQNGVTGTLSFANSNGGTANIVNNNLFQLNATSDLQQANIVNNFQMNLEGSASAGSAAIVNNSNLVFLDNSTAANATITTNALTQFVGASSGGASRQIVNSGGTLNISGSTNGFVDFGSVEGAGAFVLGGANAFVGGNNHNFVLPNAAGERVVEFSGVISGTGSVNKQGTGTWVLSGANSYSGGTSLNQGILSVSADTNLGDAVGGVTFNGGTLRFTQPVTTNRLVTLNAAGGTVDVVDGNANSTMAGVISGPGGFTKTGSGSLFFTADNTYTGLTTVADGTLLLGDHTAAGSIAGDAALTNVNSILAFKRNGAVAYAGNISGVGNVETNSFGPLTLSGNNTYSGFTRVYDNRTLIALGGNAIGNNSQVVLLNNATLRLNNSEIIGSLLSNGGGLVDLQANDLQLAGHTGGGDSTFNGAISGTGQLTKSGGFTQTLNGNQLYTGTTIVNNGRLIVNGGIAGFGLVLGGEFQLNGTGVNIATAAASVFSGNFNVNLLQNSGNVSPGNSPGTGIAVDYLGVGSPTYGVDVQTNNVGAGGTNGVTHDFLNITNSYFGANTQVLLTLTGEPVATTGQGFEIARVGNGAAAAGNLFLANPNNPGTAQNATNGFLGGFQYLVNFQNNTGLGGSDQFFLRNVVREELVANATVLAAGRQIGRDCFRGPEHTQNSDGKGNGRAWANGRYGTFESDVSNGADFDGDYFCVNGGVDLPLADGFVAGLRGGYASQDIDLNVVQGVANLDGDTWNFEAALTYANAEGYYSGLTMGYRSTDWRYRHALASGGVAGRSSADVDGVVGSLYAGYRYGLDAHSSLNFEGAVLYDATDCDANCFLPGTVEDTSDWEGRIAARYDAHWGSVRPYAVLSVTHNFSDGQRVALGNAFAEVDTASALLGLNLGVQADLGEGWTLTAEAATTQGLDSEVEGYQGLIGARKTW
jgi:autotransporter-associated beta strand protein